MRLQLICEPTPSLVDSSRSDIRLFPFPLVQPDSTNGKSGLDTFQRLQAGNISHVFTLGSIVSWPTSKCSWENKNAMLIINCICTFKDLE